VYAPVLGWRDELRRQIAQLSEEFILLWLDDFLILRPVETARIERIRLLVARQGLDYLRLTEIEGSYLFKAMMRLSAALRGLEYIPIPTGMPYYSSLQAAIWRREHLLDMLASYGQETIWGFEHHFLPARQHFSIVGPGPIRYRHLVERGKWLPYTPHLGGIVWSTGGTGLVLYSSATLECG
jgi:hypothetical protein